MFDVIVFVVVGVKFGDVSLFVISSLTSNFGLWRMLNVPDWGLASLSRFIYGHVSWIGSWLLARALAFGFALISAQ